MMKTKEIVTVNEALQAAIEGLSIFIWSSNTLESYLVNIDGTGEEFWIETYDTSISPRKLIGVHYVDKYNARIALYGTYKMEEE